MSVHAIPVNDVIEHDTNSLDCVCGPDVEYSHPDTGEFYGVPFVIHHSLDGREINDNRGNGGERVSQGL
jgi:hypothetical protein